MASRERFSIDLLYLLHRNSYSKRKIREELYRAVGEVSGGARVERLLDAINAVVGICTDSSKCQELWIRIVHVLKNLGVDAIKQLDEIDKFSRGSVEGGDVLAMVHILELGYPRRLRRVNPPAPIIFARTQHRGGAPLDNANDIKCDIKWMLSARPLIAVVGTRNPSEDGCNVAREIAMYMAGHGFSMVTGLANGIDACAAEGYLERLLKYKPIRFKPEQQKYGQGSVFIGVRPYLEPFPDSLPQRARQVIDRFRNEGIPNWIIISENASMYYEGGWIKSQLCLRNRLISSLADAIVVVEARAGEDDKLDICGSTSMIKLGLRRGKSVYIWKTKSRDEEILRGYKLYLENGAVEFSDFEELYWLLLNNNAIAYKIEDQYVIPYTLPLSSSRKIGFRVIWEQNPKEYNIPRRLLWRWGVYQSPRKASELVIPLSKGILRAPKPKYVEDVNVYTYAPGIREPRSKPSVTGYQLETILSSFDLRSLVDSIKEDPINRTVDPKSIKLAGYLLAHVFQVVEQFKGKVDAITYVPCHESNMRITPDGSKICHVEEIAKALAEYVGKPVIRVAEKIKHEDLIGMGKQERRAKVEEMYKPADIVEIIYSPPGTEVNVDKIRRLTVIDDVMTTGCTLGKIVRIARSKNYVVTWCLVVAMTV
jgi:predicted Rossmann fold nucleotide-binding protein DprA/Smf involved in DNA uptake